MTDTTQILMVVGGYIGLVVVGSLIAMARDSWKRRPSLCPHGIRGGATNGRCSKCADARLREQQEYERRANLQSAATHLRQQEANRLSGCLAPNLEELRTLSPQRFEDAVAQMFERLGYSVEQTPYVNDQGRDAILHKDGSKFLVECKRYKAHNTVGRPEIQKFHSAVMVENATKGFFCYNFYVYARSHKSRGTRKFAD